MQTEDDELRVGRCSICLWGTCENSEQEHEMIPLALQKGHLSVLLRANWRKVG